MGGGVQGFHGGFEDVAREARREMLEEAQSRRLARLARPGRSLRERLAPARKLVAGLLEAVRPRVVENREVVAGEVPDFAYLAPESLEGPGTAVEVYIGAGGCVVRRTDLLTGASTDAFVADERVER